MNKTGVVLLAIAVVGSLAVHVLLGVGLGWAFLIFFVGWPVLGTVVTIDDDLKGGWSNPDGSVRPPWQRAPFWGQILGGLAISSAGAAVDTGWTTQISIWFWLFAVIGLGIAGLMIKRGLRAHDG